MAIGVVEFDLSMTDPETGLYKTARTYTVEGVTNPDGSLRELSIGQLVMALCLSRAAEMENLIINKMSEMEATSAMLEDLTEIETSIIEEFQNNTSGHAFELEGKTTSSGTSYLTLLRNLGIMNDSQHYVRNDAVFSVADILYSDFTTKIEAKMDEKNSFSQQSMIELQSLTNKRDQSYDMISNVLKSLNTTLVGNANNL